MQMLHHLHHLNAEYKNVTINILQSTLHDKEKAAKKRTQHNIIQSGQTTKIKQ